MWHFQRFAGVLDSVADKADWNNDRSGGRIKGIAVHKSFGTYVAQVADMEETKAENIVLKKWYALTVILL